MRFASPLIPARLIQRYKRFLADVVLEDGTETTVHCANPGAMIGLSEPGARIWLSRSSNPARKLPLSWEYVEIDQGRGPELVGINTSNPNGLVMEGFRRGLIAELSGYTSLKPEVTYGRNSRVDMLLTGEGLPPAYLEVKNVHFLRRAGLAEFPDCVTARAAKHLDELGDMVAAGARAVNLFLIQYAGADRFRIARDHDAAYGAAFDRARARGVEMLAYRCRLTPDEIVVDRRVPVDEEG